MSNSYSNIYAVLIAAVLLAMPLAIADSHDLRQAPVTTSGVFVAPVATEAVALPEIVSVAFLDQKPSSQLAVRSADLDSKLILRTANSPSYVSLTINNEVVDDRAAPFEFSLDEFSLVESNTYGLVFAAHAPSGQITDVYRVSLSVRPSQPCTLTEAHWDQTTAVDGETVGFTILGDGFCDGQYVDVRIYENDFFGDDRMASAPQQLEFSDAKAAGTWVARGEDDASGNPEFYIFASLGNGRSVTSNEELVVERPRAQVVPQVRQLTLVSAGRALSDLRTLKDGGYYTINRQDLLSEFTIRADATTSTESVQFLIDGDIFQTENQEPYVLSGDLGGRYQSWVIPDGEYKLDVIPYTLDQAQGVAGRTYSVMLNIINEQPAPNQVPQLFVDLETPLVTVGEAVYVDVVATDSDGKIEELTAQFGDEVLSVSDPDFRFEFVALSPGLQPVSITATDDDGSTTTQAVDVEVRAVAVDPVPNLPPLVKVEILPNPVEVGQEFIIDVDPSDSDGTITRVAVGLPGEIIELDPPYELARTVFVEGEYPIYITVEDDDGAIFNEYASVTVVEATPEVEPYLSWVSPPDGFVGAVDVPVRLQAALMNVLSPVARSTDQPQSVVYVVDNDVVATENLGEPVFWSTAAEGEYVLQAYLADDPSVSTRQRTITLSGPSCACPAGYVCTPAGCVLDESDDYEFGEVNRLTLIDASTGRDLLVLNPGEELVLSNIYTLRGSVIDVEDYGSILSFIANGYPQIDEEAADVSGDGQITSYDSALLQEMIKTFDLVISDSLTSEDASIVLVLAAADIDSSDQIRYLDVNSDGVLDSNDQNPLGTQRMNTELLSRMIEYGPVDLSRVDEMDLSGNGEISAYDASLYLQMIEDRDVIGGRQTLSVRADTDTSVDSVAFSLNGQTVFIDQNSPYYLAGESSSGSPNAAGLRPGYHTIAATATTDGQSTQRYYAHVQINDPKVTFPPIEEVASDITGLFLVAADTGKKIYELEDDGVYVLTEHQASNLDILAETEGKVASMYFSLRNVFENIDNTEPFHAYSLADARMGPLSLTDKTYSLAALAYSRDDAQGEILSQSNIDFTLSVERAPVIDIDPRPQAPADVTITSVWLVDASTGTRMYEITDGAVLTLTEKQAANIDLQAFTGADTESVFFEIEGVLQHVDNLAPFVASAGGTVSRAVWQLEDRRYKLIATPYSEDNTKGDAGTPFEAGFSVSIQKESRPEDGASQLEATTGTTNPGDGVVSFTIVDAASGEEIATFDGDIILADYDEYVFAGRTINIRADVKGDYESVAFSINDDPYSVDSAPPYYISPDAPGTFSYFAFRPSSLYTFSAVPYEFDKAQGTAGPGLKADVEFP